MSDGHDQNAISLNFKTMADFWAFIEQMSLRAPPASDRLVKLGNEVFGSTGLTIIPNPTTGTLEIHDAEEPPPAPLPTPPPPPTPPAPSPSPAPAVTTDPAQRERMREAAAEAREKVAQLAQEPPPEKAAVKPVTETTQKKKRGRPAKAAGAADAKVTTEDQSGDPETGDRAPDEANLAEPTDYDASATEAPALKPVNGTGEAPPAGAPTPPVIRAALIERLRLVHDIDRKGVEDVVSAFGVQKLSAIPDDRVGDLWVLTEELCVQHKIAFPPEGMTAP